MTLENPINTTLRVDRLEDALLQMGELLQKITSISSSLEDIASSLRSVLERQDAELTPVSVANNDDAYEGYSRRSHKRKRHQPATEEELNDVFEIFGSKQPIEGQLAGFRHHLRVMDAAGMRPTKKIAAQNLKALEVGVGQPASEVAAIWGCSVDVMRSMGYYYVKAGLMLSNSKVWLRTK